MQIKTDALEREKLMPGIAGFITKKPMQNSKKNLDIMLKAMEYEEFYLNGKYINEQLGLYVGWVAHKESFVGGIPIHNVDNDKIIILHGEIIRNHDESKIINPSYVKRKQNSTNYIKNLYNGNEIDFLRRLNGFFNGLIIDLRKRKIILFNDRYGMKRIYFHEKKDSFYFASEAKSILNLKTCSRSISNQCLAELVSFQCVFENRSLYKNISLLPGGSYWNVTNGKNIKRKEYFNPKEYEDLPKLDKLEFIKRLKSTLENILIRYFSYGENIVLSLTGGLDTRTILSNVPILDPNIKFYSHSGIYRECYDVKIAKEIAKICNLPHSTLKIDKTFILKFTELAKKTIYISDGYMDLNGTPSLYLHGKARKIGKIRLSGNYGDQVLRNVRNLVPNPVKSKWLNKDFHRKIDDAIVCLKDLSTGHPLTFFLFKQAPWFDYSRYSVEQSQMVQITPFMDNDLIRLLYQAPDNMLEAKDVRMILVKDGRRGLSKIPTDRGYLGDDNKIVIAVRHFIREILFKIEYYFSYGMPNWLAKLNCWLSYFEVEKMFLERNKYYNFRRWFGSELSDFVKDILLDDRTLKRPFVNNTELRRMVNNHINKTENHTTSINRMISVELAFRLLVENDKLS